YLQHTPPAATSTLFPYTTLFRSEALPGRRLPARGHAEISTRVGSDHEHPRRLLAARGARVGRRGVRGPQRHRITLRQPAGRGPRSEEHTSELQSRFDLVCRLLLE